MLDSIAEIWKKRLLGEGRLSYLGEGIYRIISNIILSTKKLEITSKKIHNIDKKNNQKTKKYIKLQ